MDVPTVTSGHLNIPDHGQSNNIQEFGSFGIKFVVTV